MLRRKRTIPFFRETPKFTNIFDTIETQWINNTSNSQYGLFFATENTDIHGKITNGNHEEISEWFFFVFLNSSVFFRVFRG